MSLAGAPARHDHGDLGRVGRRLEQPRRRPGGRPTSWTATKPGSIILLHDGIDGTVHADRSVLLTALPLILDGLQERGLQPVRLDQLLGKPGYVPC